ncbi:MAG: hypothetical protein AAFQ94_04135 [Bacteroidota bacterium]
MSLSNKGSRNIEVDGIQYIFKVSKVKRKSDWRTQSNELDETFMKYASYYGLGNVKDATINVVIELASTPVSKLFVKIHTLIVDGFMGPPQIISITPKLVAHLLRKGLKEGWKPDHKGDHQIELIQQKLDQKKPLILQLPNMNEEATSYENLEKPMEIYLE